MHGACTSGPVLAKRSHAAATVTLRPKRVQFEAWWHSRPGSPLPPSRLHGQKVPSHRGPRQPRARPIFLLSELRASAFPPDGLPGARPRRQHSYTCIWGHENKGDVTTSSVAPRRST